MQTELPAQAVAAIATVIAALITAAISFVNLTLNKEQKTSEFRQAWIDGLREDLSSFFACARAFARASEEHKAFGPSKENGTYLAMTAEKISEIRYEGRRAEGAALFRTTVCGLQPCFSRSAKNILHHVFINTQWNHAGDWVF